MQVIPFGLRHGARGAEDGRKKMTVIGLFFLLFDMCLDVGTSFV
jgi:hypothetical protein